MVTTNTVLCLHRAVPCTISMTFPHCIHLIADYRSPKQYLSSNERPSQQVVDDFNFELELAHAMQQNPQQWA
jgi:hypothetical protein